MNVEVIAVPGLPEIHAGDDLAALIAERASLVDGDVVVVAQKVVSKAEDAFATLRPGEDPADGRRRLAREQASRIVADTPWVLIVETTHGFVCANAGIDASNVPGERLTLLPQDPDASARGLREGLARHAGVDVGVVISDTFGRPWRLGQTDVAIGVAGLEPLRDERGGHDRDGVVLEVTEVAVADELAAAADLVRRKADGVPVVVVRGTGLVVGNGRGARALVRPPDADLFPRAKGMLAGPLVDARDAGPPPGDQGHAGDDLDRCLRVARRAVPGARFAVAPPDAAGLREVVVSGDDVEAGAGAIALVALLADLGHAARWRRIDDRAAGSVLVAVGGGPRIAATQVDR